MFWGHRPPRSGGVGAGCLSQWWPADFVVDGVVYRTAEHFMMAGKARLFGDEESAAAIVAADHPGQVKDLGRRVRGFDEEKWTAARFDLVVRGNFAKFGRHADLREFLLGTGERVLVEASPVDRVWGIGLAADDERAEKPELWPGLNLLGFALMEVRHALRRS
ncbi:NADAR family protein [Streptosporangium sp. NPDC049046]